MPSNWIKQPQQLNQVRYLNSGSGDSVVGGAITGIPSTVIASQGIQNLPGDRMILGAADALALSDSTVGTLYGGLYMYVRTKSGSTATPTRGHLAFKDTAVADSLYQVTPDEGGSQGVNIRAGVYINTLTKGYYWWILVAGKAVVQFRASLTGTAADGCGAYAAAVGSGEPGVANVLAGADMGNNTALYYGIVDNMLARYLGVCEGAPSNNNLSIVNIPLRFISAF